MDESLIKLLEPAGFTDKEAKVYLALLELGRGTVAEIAKKSDLKRPIIYVLLEGLIKRGYASELPDQKINTFQAIDPAVILNQLKTGVKNFSEMIPILQTLGNRGHNKPKISYYENLSGIWNAYEEMNHIKDSFFITSYAKLDKLFPKEVENWFKNYDRGLYQLAGKHLIPDTPGDRVIGQRLIKADQQVRLLSGIRNLGMDFSVYGNKLAITAFDENPFAIIMESAGIVKSLREIFDLVWKNAKELA